MSVKSANLFSSRLFCKKQSGAILVMFTIGLFAIIAMATLALDSSHMLLNKGRLQNAVDSAALSAAKKLQDGGSLVEARQTVIAILSQNLSHGENKEIQDVVTLSIPDYGATQVTEHVSVEFSALPDPFTPNDDETYEYVRVSVEEVALDNFLAQIFNFDKKVRASAIAGRSTDIECLNQVVPILACANTDPDVENFGMVPGNLTVLKTGSSQDPSLGPGNFQLLDLEGSGGKGVNFGLAGEYSPGSCVSVGQTVDTEPGNKVGPTDGINTRFGEWGGQLNKIDHPRDANTCYGDILTIDASSNITNQTFDNYYSYADYVNNTKKLFCGINDIKEPSSEFKSDRRKLSVVIGNCDGKINGKNKVEVLAIGCFFLTQPATAEADNGNGNGNGNGQKSYIIGEYISECTSTGNASLDPDFDSDNFTIVLYRDLDSPDS
ncbi:Tad domain-containing protein [Shewanella sp. 0m-8]